MVKILVLFVLFTILTAKTVLSNSVTNQNLNILTEVKRPQYKLRKLGIFELRQIRDWLKPYLIILEEQERLEKQDIERMEQNKLREDNERRRVYEKHLLVYQGGSSVLKDFHTNLF